MIVVAQWIARRSRNAKITGSNLLMVFDVILNIIYFQTEGDRRAIFYRYTLYNMYI